MRSGSCGRPPATSSGRVGRWRVPGLVEEEEALDHVGQTLRVGALRKVDGDDAAVDVDAGRLARGEQPPSHLVDRTNVVNDIGGPVALVTHPGERTVDLEADDARVRPRVPLGDGDRLPHRGPTVAAPSPETTRQPRTVNRRGRSSRSDPRPRA